MGWVGPYGEQRGAGGGLGDGGGWGGWGGLRGDPELGAACLIGAHLHSSGAGDIWRAFPALSAKWLPLHIYHESDCSSCLFTCFSLRIFQLFLQIWILEPSNIAIKCIVKVIIKNTEQQRGSSAAHTQVVDMPRKLNYKWSAPLIHYAVVI